MRAIHRNLAALGLLAAGAACAPAAPAADPAPVAATAADTPVRQLPPPALPAREIRFPSFTETALPNGLRMIVVQDTTLPVLDVDLYLAPGAAADPAARAGLASMVADMLARGTPGMSARQISERIEGVGGSIGTFASDDQLGVSVNALAEQDTLVFSLLSDVVLRPTFPEDELASLRTQTLSQLRAQLAQPGAVANRAFARALFGGHPYGVAARPETVEAITRDDVRGFHRTYFRPGNALLVVAGDISPERARELADRHFGEWSGARAAVPATAAPPAPAPARIHLVHRPGSAQVNLIVGGLGLGPDHPDFYPLRVATQVLGGGPDARLFQVLRQEKGWTYGSYASLDRSRDRGAFEATAEVRPEVADSALIEILRQVRQLRDEPVSAEEFEAARSFLLGSYPLGFETPGQTANRLATNELIGLPADEITRYMGRIAAVTREDLQRAARAHLSPDSAVIVAVGDASKLLPLLEPIAPVVLTDVEGKPLERSAVEVRASTDRFDASGLQPVTLTYGIQVQGNTMATAQVALAREGDVWVGTQTAPPGATSEVRFTGDFTPLSFKQAVPPAGIDVSLTFADGRVKGTATLPQQMGGNKTFDEAVVAGTRLPNMDSWILATADLAQGKTIALPIFSPMGGGVTNFTATVVGSESVTVPAGTFETWKVETTGGQGGGTLYLTKDAPHTVVKQEIAGQPVVLVLQSVER